MTKHREAIDCARCGETHDVELVPFEHQSDGAVFTHWGMCSTTGEPVLITFGDSEDYCIVGKMPARSCVAVLGVLRSVAHHRTVILSSSDPRWAQAAQAYKDICRLFDVEPAPWPAGTPKPKGLE